MVYRVIGTMSGSSLDGLDIAFVELQESFGRWTYTMRQSACYAYSGEWAEKLTKAKHLNGLDYQLLHTDYGHYTGQQIHRFIQENNIQYQVQLISCHGHTVFHSPEGRMTAQLGSGAAIAAETGINVVSDLRAMDIALGGQGAPIVPIGEKLMFGEYMYFLNLGGIANISLNLPDQYIAYDVCPANRVLNMLAKKAGVAYDDEGRLAEEGEVNDTVLGLLDELEYYRLPYPKSLSNDFGTDVIYPLIHHRSTHINEDLRTYVEHICQQVANAVARLQHDFSLTGKPDQQMLITGGGAKNKFLVDRLREVLAVTGINVTVPSVELVDFKEAIIMALIGVLRWREEYNTLSSVTGASRNSIGGAVWIGQEA